MGLFDELITDEEHVRCPQCGAKIDSLQSKSLPDPGLDQYRLGDKLAVPTHDGLAELIIEEGRMLGYDSCRSCGAWSDWHAIIHDKRWVRTELVDWRPGFGKTEAKSAKTRNS
jgi:hypothetical protein